MPSRGVWTLCHLVLSNCVLETSIDALHGHQVPHGARFGEIRRVPRPIHRARLCVELHLRGKWSHDFFPEYFSIWSCIEVGQYITLYFLLEVSACSSLPWKRKARMKELEDYLRRWASIWLGNAVRGGKRALFEHSHEGGMIARTVMVMGALDRYFWTSFLDIGRTRWCKIIGLTFSMVRSATMMVGKIVYPPIRSSSSVSNSLTWYPWCVTIVCYGAV